MFIGLDYIFSLLLSFEENRLIAKRRRELISSAF